MSFGFENVKPIHARGTDAAEVIEVIRTKAMRGAGIEEDPVREVTQYWTFDGKLIGEEDSFFGKIFFFFFFHLFCREEISFSALMAAKSESINETVASMKVIISSIV